VETGDANVQRSAMSYEREIRSLEQRLSEECANSKRLADELALRDHIAANPTPPSGPSPATTTVGELSQPKTTMFRKPDGSALITITLRHTFSKMTRVRRRRDAGPT